MLGGTRLKNRWVIILVAVGLCLMVSGCDSPTPVPTSNHGSNTGTNTNANGGYSVSAIPTNSPSTGNTVPESTYMPTEADVEASDNAVMEASSAIQFNDPSAFTALMAAETLTHVSGTPDLTTPEAKKVGEALQNAYMVRAEADAFVYETTMDGVQISFMVIKEDGAWKISGL
jgi:hypothetical protein